MEVYVLLGVISYERTFVLGVYSTYQKAVQAKEKNNDVFEKNKHDIRKAIDFFVVEKRFLDGEIVLDFD